MRQKDILRYTKEEVPRGTVYSHYSRWRGAQNMPVRCDEPSCAFYTEPLVWNEKALKPILDHRNGNNSDNRPENLRFLCPNCDSQLPTRGGANRGRVEKSEGGFALVSRDGRRDFILPAEGNKYVVKGAPTRLVVKNNRATGSGRKTPAAPAVKREAEEYWKK
jgi:hypothetical protein